METKLIGGSGDLNDYELITNIDEYINDKNYDDIIYILKFIKHMINTFINLNIDIKKYFDFEYKIL